MSVTVLDGTVAVLHGTADNSLHWVWLSSKHGRESIALVDSRGFWVRDLCGAPGVDAIAGLLARLWSDQRAGVDLSGHATHRLVPPQLQEIVPIQTVDAIGQGLLDLTQGAGS